MKNEHAEICSLLKRALEGELTLDDARNFMAGLSRHDDQRIQEAAHMVIHFLDDADIRERDAGYENYMRGKLEDYIKCFEGLD